MDPFSTQQGQDPYYDQGQQPPVPPQPQFMQQPQVPQQQLSPQLPFEHRQSFRQGFAQPQPGPGQMPPSMQQPESIPEMSAMPQVPFMSSAPEPPASQPLAPALPRDPEELRPIPVVKVLSPVGVEYVFLTLTLLVGASALTGALLVLVNGAVGFDALAFPAATLLVTVPVFALIFLHLKRLELNHPELKLDPSKRRSTQATQIISFVVSLFTLIGFFAAVMASLGGGIHESVGKAALDALCVLAVAGGILFYYWHDEHGMRR